MLLFDASDYAQLEKLQDVLSVDERLLINIQAIACKNKKYAL